LTWLGYLHVALFIGLGAVILSAFRFLGAKAPTVGTWDCGYVAPTARMQYTASSIAADFLAMFAGVLRPRGEVARLKGPWPGRHHFHSHVPEVVLDLLVMPTLRVLGRLVEWLRSIQRGTVHSYVFVVMLTLIVMLSVWR